MFVFFKLSFNSVHPLCNIFYDECDVCYWSKWNMGVAASLTDKDI